MVKHLIGDSPKNAGHGDERDPAAIKEKKRNRKKTGEKRTESSSRDVLLEIDRINENQIPK